MGEICSQKEGRVKKGELKGEIMRMIFEDLIMRVNNEFFLDVLGSDKCRDFKVRTKNKCYSKRVLRKCVEKMIWTGNLCLIQRPFWRWKMQVRKKFIKPESCRRDFRLTMRILVNRITQKSKKVCRSAFSQIQDWASRKYYTNSKTSSNLIVKSALITLGNVLKKQVKSFFQRFRQHNLLKTQKKLAIRGLKLTFHKGLKNKFDFWRNNLVYTYSEELQEVQTATKYELKHFNVKNKPCISLCFIDYHSYDPAFQAVFRNLNHFIKRITRKSFQLWQQIISNKPSITSYGSILTDVSLDYNIFKLSQQEKKKLEQLVFHLSFISEKRNDFSKRTLSRWVEQTNIQNLKIARLKLIICKSQKENEMKKYGYMKFCYNLAHVPEFTDLY